MISSPCDWLTLDFGLYALYILSSLSVYETENKFFINIRLLSRKESFFPFLKFFELIQFFTRQSCNQFDFLSDWSFLQRMPTKKNSNELCCYRWLRAFETKMHEKNGRFLTSFYWYDLPHFIVVDRRCRFKTFFWFFVAVDSWIKYKKLPSNESNRISESTWHENSIH